MKKYPKEKKNITDLSIYTFKCLKIQKQRPMHYQKWWNIAVASR